MSYKTLLDHIKPEPVPMYAVDKTRPRVRKRKATKVPPPAPQSYLTTGHRIVTVEDPAEANGNLPARNPAVKKKRKKPEQKFEVGASEKKCYQQNWNEFKTPDSFVSYKELHPSQHKLLKILIHRAKAANHCDIKIRESDIAGMMGITPRYVRKLIQELVGLGFIGRCWARFRNPETGKLLTWRMIRVHYNSWKFRWNFLEKVTRLKTDFRPASRVLTAIHGYSQFSFQEWVLAQKREIMNENGQKVAKPLIHPKWAFEEGARFSEDGVFHYHYPSPWSYQNDSTLTAIYRAGYYDPNFDDSYDTVKTEGMLNGKLWAVKLLGNEHDNERGTVV